MRCVLVILVLALMLVPACAQADNDHVGFRGWGPRIGLTVDPDQVHFGMHLDFGNFAERVRFQPNFELGLGDHVTVAALNFEGAYRFRSNWAAWTPYAGGGLGLNFVSWDDEYARGDNSDTELGLNILGGVERGLSNGDRFFAEIKFGLGDSPDFKFTVGWTFYHGLL
jgi:opacity protein-like surface antigen